MLGITSGIRTNDDIYTYCIDYDFSLEFQTCYGIQLLSFSINIFEIQFSRPH